MGRYSPSHPLGNASFSQKTKNNIFSNSFIAAKTKTKRSTNLAFKPEGPKLEGVGANERHHRTEPNRAELTGKDDGQPPRHEGLVEQTPAPLGRLSVALLLQLQDLLGGQNAVRPGLVLVD